MTETIDKPTITQDMCDRRQRALIALINLIAKTRPEVHHRISAHFWAVTGNKHGNIATYHMAKSISMEAKYVEYAKIAAALGCKEDANGVPRINANGLEWSKLQGSLGAGAKVVETDQVVKRADPLAGISVADIPVVDDEPEEPAVTPRSVRELVSSPAVPVARPVQGSTTDDLATLLARLVEGKLNLPPQAAQVAPTVDDGVIRLIVAEELDKLDIGAAVKKANSNGAFPTDRVDKLIQDALAKHVHRIEIVQPNGDMKPLEGLMHPQVTQIATWLAAGVPVWAWGGAGAGKTHLARQVATILDVAPYVISVDPTLTVSKLLGYRNVTNGEFVEGFLYKGYKGGGLDALDEIDTGDPGVVASTNAMVSNAHYLFPNGETVDRHPKFHMLALANTKGTGAVAGYTARNRLDAATLDRFAIIELKYDTGLEMALACGIGSPGTPWKAGTPASQEAQAAYVTWVQKVREHVGNSVLVSPRASINGCKALRVGIPMQEVIEALVFKLVADDSRKRIVDTCGLPTVTV